MNPFHRVLAAGLLALLWVAVPAGAEEARPDDLRFEVPGPVPLLQTGWQLDRPAEVLVSDDALLPRRVEIESGRSVLWRSVARHASEIVFEREVARSMVCHSLVNFQLRGDRLVSAPLQTGDEASFCQLAPGTYRYRIERHGPAERPSAGGHQLSTRLEGVIVVRPAEEGAAPMAVR
jgi:hypothetical protein